SEAFVQLARQGTTCCMIPHLQIEKELESGELINLTPGLLQRRFSTRAADIARRGDSDPVTPDCSRNTWYYEARSSSFFVWLNYL
ncbi:hypothetical protein MJM45_30540, partial [Salmonella enterica subsp. enterica serovar Kentucky]|nr:hypothetical protein [Salmonella enterica subsp. enterica serovar Kentucky]